MLCWNKSRPDGSLTAGALFCALIFEKLTFASAWWYDKRSGS